MTNRNVHWKRYTFLALLFCLSFTGCGQQEEVNKEVELQTTTVRNVNYDLTRAALGTVTKVMTLKCSFRQTKEVDLSFKIEDEIITNVYVESGDQVKKGDVLASVNVEAAKKEQSELEHQLALDELHLKHLIEKRDFELEQADILFSYTERTQEDREALEEQKQSVTESYAKRIQDKEDTVYFERRRLEECTEYVECGQLLSPMDGTVGYVKSNLEGSLAKKDECVIRVYEPDSKLFTCSETEAIPYVEDDREYTITCGLGKNRTDYTVVAANREQWREEFYFRLLEEDYDPKNVENGKLALTLEEKQGVLCLAQKAIHSSGEEYYVYTLDEDNVRRMQFVEVGLWGEDVVEILSGLDEGDRVILK